MNKPKFVSHPDDTDGRFQIARDRWDVDLMWKLLEVPPDFPRSSRPISDTSAVRDDDAESDRSRLCQANLCENIAYAAAQVLEGHDFEAHLQESALLQMFSQLNQKLVGRVTLEETFWIVRRTAGYLEWECPELNLESGCKAFEEASKLVSEDD